MELGLGAKVDFDAQCVFDFQLQPNDSKERRTWRQIDQQIEIAPLLVNPSGNGTKYPHAACPMRRRQG